MRHFKIERKTFLTIAWCLTGLLLGGSFLNSLSAAKDSAVCAEERALEVDDDDRSDSLQLEAAILNRIDERPTSQTWQELHVFYCLHALAAIPSANLQRGPPCC
jgi:hypothetical protein